MAEKQQHSEVEKIVAMQVWAAKMNTLSAALDAGEITTAEYVQALEDIEERTRDHT